jgi:hypothetical protein
VVIYPGEVLAFQNIERQAHALRAPAPSSVVKAPPAAPDPGEDDFEGIDGGKLRCTGATWSDAVVIYPGEVLAFQNIERQAHALRAPAPSSVVKAPPAAPDPGEDDFEGVE